MTSRAGFTLIELLVSVAIMTVLLGGGMAAYFTFQTRQDVVNTTKELQLMMRSAQVKARAGDRPTGCDRLQSYKVAYVASPQSVTLSAVCSSGTTLVSTYTPPSGITIASFSDKVFKVLAGGVTGAGNVAVSSQSPSYTYTFAVDAGGNVSEGTMVKN